MKASHFFHLFSQAVFPPVTDFSWINLHFLQEVMKYTGRRWHWVPSMWLLWEANIKLLINIYETWAICLGLHKGTEKAMAPPSSPLAWKIPWMEEPGRLQSMGSRLSDFTFTFDFHALEKEMATHCNVLGQINKLMNKTLVPQRNHPKT